ncbi:hypothetical protein [Thermodesulfatator atlanticus]|uniref:hypothetical protein n=1 Tax=Thermodesulfatator atlanticus TaxID=501497 RepID=UPI0003B36CAB|nr:hypothetical protein [Thermodesulfatator atlanticus]
MNLRARFFNFSPRINFSRLFIYGLPLVLSLYFALTVLWPAWQDYQTKKTLYEEKKALISRYQERLTKDKPKLEKELAQTKNLGEKVFVGLDPYIIISELEKDIKDIPQLNLRSFRIIKRKKLTPQVEKIKLLLVLEGDVKGLLSLLEKLNKTEKALRISRMTISSRFFRRAYIINLNLEIEALYSQEAL